MSLAMDRMLWVFRLAWVSARGRWPALLLVMLSVSVSTVLLVGTVQLRSDAQRSFSEAVSGVDLIVGPKGSPAELLLYTAFQIGQPTRNFPAERLEEIRRLPEVAWAMPLQLGDSFQGNPVWGTDATFFDHYAVQGRAVALHDGRAFRAEPSAPAEILEAVVGARVADDLGLSVGDSVVLTHGMQATEGPLSQDHSDAPVVVVGVLAPTGGPVDGAVLISLEAFEWLHSGGGLPWMASAGPAQLTALWVGLSDRSMIFSVRDRIERLGEAELMAVLPGVALDELWRVLGVAEASLRIIGYAMAVGAALSVSAVLLVAINGRRRELSILRAVGVGLGGISALVVAEAFWVVAVGLVLGLGLHQILLSAAEETLRSQLGLSVALGQIPSEALMPMAVVLLAGLVAGLLPALLASRLSLADGLNPPSG